MESFKNFANDLKGVVGRYGEFPVKQEKVRQCAGPCRRDIFLQTYKDGSTKETGCACDKVRKDHEIIKVKKSNAFLNASQVPYSSYKAKFENFDISDEDPQKEKQKQIAKTIAERYVNKFAADIEKKRLIKRIEKSRLSIELFNQEFGTNVSEEIFEQDEKTISNLVMQGAPGSGKTMLAATVFHEIAKQNYNCYFIEATTFIEILKESFEDSSKKERLFKFCSDADLLVVDDLGTSFNSGWATDQFKLLADMRQNKFTIYTTNLTEREFLESMALHRIYSRMNENAATIDMNFEDRRLKRGINHDTD